MDSTMTNGFPRLTAHTSPAIGSRSRAVDGFLQRVERDQAQRGADRRVRPVGAQMLAQEPREPLEGHLVESLPLHDAPLLERQLVDGEAREEVARVDGDRPLERLQPAVGHGGLELRHVHHHHRGIERDGISARQEGGRLVAAEGAAQTGQRLAEALAGLRVGPLAPEEGGELLPGVEAPGRQGQIRGQGLDLPHRQSTGIAAVQPVGGEAAEQLDPEPRRLSHGAVNLAHPLPGDHRLAGAAMSDGFTAWGAGAFHAPFTPPG
jgi:hypothetical protein